jgi:hypothetical protein
VGSIRRLFSYEESQGAAGEDMRGTKKEEKEEMEEEKKEEKKGAAPHAMQRKERKKEETSGLVNVFFIGYLYFVMYFNRISG